ncbi:hypothetical protein ACQKGI_21325 [Peribacillus muralis]|uniref:hypothetical protein n=1 Tax=Peribacillus muralis TaxID=264697 RepID=UPI000AB0D8CA
MNEAVFHFQIQGYHAAFAKIHIIRKKAGMYRWEKGRFIDIRLTGGVSLNRLKSF